MCRRTAGPTCAAEGHCSRRIGSAPTGSRSRRPPAELLGEERRLFYVAVTRARRRLVVTAVDSPEDDGQRPSRFCSELGVPVVQVEARARRPLTLPALVVELRSVVSDPGASESLRSAAAERLARLAAARTPGGAALVPGAHPDSLVGSRRHHPVRNAPAPGGSAAPAVRVLAHRDRRLPAALVPRPRGRRQLGARRCAGLRIGGARPGGRGRARPAARGRRRLDGAGRPRVEPARVRGPLAVGEPARAGAGGTGPVPALARASASRGPRGRRHRGQVQHDDPGRRPGRPPARVDGPRRARRRRAGGRRRPQDRQGQADRCGRRGAPAARALSAGRTPRSARRRPSCRRPATGGRRARAPAAGRDQGRDPALRAGQAGTATPSSRWTWRSRSLVAVERMVLEDFPPTPGDRCGMCAYRSSCPAQPEGRMLS